MLQVDINKEKLEAVEQRCKKAGVEVLPLVMDLSELPNNEKAVQDTIAKFGSKSFHNKKDVKMLARA